MKVIPSPAALGAIIEGIDLRQLDDAAFTQVKQAWLDNLVIVARRQKLTDDDLTAFSQRFGVLDEVPPIGKGQKPRDNKYVSVVSNVVENGVPIGGLGDDEVIWHSDTSYREHPPSASVLYGLEIPAWGGNTGFSNMYLALETMPEDLRRRIDGLSVKNDMTYNAGGYLREGFEPVTDVRKCPGATHPIVRTHPDTGKNCLYLGRRRNAYIQGLEIEESEKLLDVLWAHATQEYLSWHHVWQVGDIVIWDNRCVMHHRDPFDPNSRRIMHRAQARDGRRPFRDPAVMMDAAAHPRGQAYWRNSASRQAVTT
jgi:taurine dioxygenase